MVGALVVMVQGFWKTRSYLGGLEARNGDALASHERAVNHWGGVHSALSLVVVIFAAVHSALFFPSLLEPSLAIWLGAAAFLILIILNLSGVLTESRRNSRKFGPFKRLHVILMLAVLGLALVHVEGLISGLFVRSILMGSIVGFEATLIVFVTVPLTVRGPDKDHSFRRVS